MRLRLALSLAALLTVTPALASPLLVVAQGKATVARDGAIEIHTPDSASPITLAGAPDPVVLAVSEDGSRTAVASSDGTVLLLGPSERTTIDSSLAITELRFSGDVLWALDGLRGILLMEARGSFTRVGEFGPDSRMLATHEESVYLVAQSAREVVRIDSSTGAVLHRGSIPDAAGDMTIAASGVYLTLPRTGEVLVLDRLGLVERERFRLGRAPTGVAITGTGGALGPATIWVADPATGGVISDEASQSMPAAISRGFLRGLLGLGLANARVHELPGRPSRVQAAAGGVIAQELTTGVLWSIRGKRIVRIGEARHGAFAYDPSAKMATWLEASSGQIRWFNLP